MRSHFLLLASLAAARGNENFTMGQICAGVDMSLDASDMLRGKHLRVMDSEYGNVAYKDAGQPKGWGGMDIALLDQVSDMLGFTYEMFDMGVPEGDEGWTGLLRRKSEESDLVACYWSLIANRFEWGVFLHGHIDISPVLVARVETKKTSWEASFLTFTRPFETSLWLMIVLIVLLSGVVDFMVERKRQARALDLPSDQGNAGPSLTSSLYEYCAGFLWGGFGSPHSRISAVYQILMGFIVLIVISAYTANLAAWLTLSVQPSKSVESMDDAVAKRQPLCSFAFPGMERVRKEYPRAHFSQEGSAAEAANRLTHNDRCDGLVTEVVQYHTERGHARHCKQEMQQVLFPEVGGWMTNKYSHCVSMAISYALVTLQNSGELNRIYLDYHPQEVCVSSSSSGRRQLATSTSRSASDDSANTDGAPSESVKPMSMADFGGIFVMWGGFSALVVMVAYMPASCQAQCSGFRGATKTRPLNNDGQGMHEDFNSLKDTQPEVMQIEHSNNAIEPLELQ